jgi:hypothetical protein
MWHEWERGGTCLGCWKGKTTRKVKIDLLEMNLDGVDWIGLAQDRYKWRALLNAVMNLRVP